MLGRRLLSASVIIAILFCLLYAELHYPVRRGELLVSGLWLVPLTLFVTQLAAAEVIGFLDRVGLRRPVWEIYWGNLMVVGGALVPVLWPLSGQPYPADCALGVHGWPWLAMGAAITLVFCAEMLRYKQPGKSAVQVALAIFAIAYTGLLPTFLVALRMWHGDRWGLAALLSLIAIVKMSDVGAYAGGRLLGRHKLAPILSPGKTIEGAVAGLLSGCLVALAFYAFVVPWLVGEEASLRGPWWAWLLYGLLAGIAGILGDLAESMLKRDGQKKDSSYWLPGLGGMLDVADSLFVAAPVCFVCWLLGLVGPG